MIHYFLAYVILYAYPKKMCVKISRNSVNRYSLCNFKRSWQNLSAYFNIYHPHNERLHICVWPQIRDAKQPAEFLSALAKYRDLLARIPMAKAQKVSHDQVFVNIWYKIIISTALFTVADRQRFVPGSSDSQLTYVHCSPDRKNRGK